MVKRLGAVQLYEVGWSGYEEFVSTILMHERSFSTKQFRQMFHESAIRPVQMAQKRRRQYLRGEPDDIGTWYCHVHADVIKAMCRKFGFRVLTVSESRSIFLNGNTSLEKCASSDMSDETVLLANALFATPENAPADKGGER